VEISIINGIFADTNSDYRNAYPINMMPVPMDNGISKGYLKPSEGLVGNGTGPGVDRGGIVWNNVTYRVMGTSLVSISSIGTVTILGTIPGSEQVSMDYGFDRLAICANKSLYYWNGTTLTQVTDPDLGSPIYVVWNAGYFCMTDGTSIVVTDLNNPTAINPLKYGSSEVDPDKILSLKRIRGELYAMNRNTMEVFNNIGGDFFPFQRVDGAAIQRGALGTHCSVQLLDSIAFLGSGRNEAPAIWIGVNATTEKISTREIDQVIQGYSEAVLALSIMEVRITQSHQWLYLHLPDVTLVYDATASRLIQQPVWFRLYSGLVRGQYRARNFLYCYDKWLCSDPQSSTIGYLTDSISTHYGQMIDWEFSTNILYNDGMGAIIHQLELVGLPGNVAFGSDPVIWTSYSEDGETWSMERSIKAGQQGERNKRMAWFQQGSMSNYRIQKFRGTSDAHVSISRLEANIERLMN
jgi:hypothetical protein